MPYVHLFPAQEHAPHVHAPTRSHPPTRCLYAGGICELSTSRARGLLRATSAHLSRSTSSKTTVDIIVSWRRRPDELRGLMCAVQRCCPAWLPCAECTRFMLLRILSLNVHLRALYMAFYTCLLCRAPRRRSGKSRNGVCKRKRMNSPM